MGVVERFAAPGSKGAEEADLVAKYSGRVDEPNLSGTGFLVGLVLINKTPSHGWRDVPALYSKLDFAAQQIGAEHTNSAIADSDYLFRVQAGAVVPNEIARLEYSLRGLNNAFTIVSIRVQWRSRAGYQVVFAKIVDPFSLSFIGPQHGEAKRR